MAASPKPSKSAPRDAEEVSVASASSACGGDFALKTSERSNGCLPRPKGKRVVAPLRSARPRSIRRRTNFLWSSPPALLRGRRVRQRGKALFRYFLCPCRLPVRSRAHEFAMPLSLDVAACLTSICARAPIVFASYIHRWGRSRGWRKVGASS